MMTSVKKVLFVCLGNTCRSPIAEAVFTRLIKEKNVEGKWAVSSAGTGGWQVGCPMDKRAKATLLKYDITHDHHARQIERAEYDSYDYIFGMDDYNVSTLRGNAPAGSKARIILLGDFDPLGDRIIEDPIFEAGSELFEKCYQQCMRCCTAFLEKHG